MKQREKINYDLGRTTTLNFQSGLVSSRVQAALVTQVLDNHLRPPVVKFARSILSDHPTNFEVFMSISLNATLLLCAMFQTLTQR